MIDVRVLTGTSLATTLLDVAQLRIQVFREWPYLYDGDIAYEQQYLQVYRESADAILVGAFDGAACVGAATGAPLGHHADDFAAAFADTGLDLADIFYCAESVLLPEFRGQGVGHRFFDLRESHARRLGFRKVAFCAVERPENHPLRPRAHRSLKAFWRRRGYVALPGVVARFAWKDVDQPKETEKPLQFWIRDL